MITREEYNKALDIVEAYHKQLFIGAVVSSNKPLSKVQKGDYVRCKILHEQCKKSLTKGKQYEVIDINDSRPINIKLYFYIIDDNGKKKRYADDNRQFEVV